ETEVIKPYMPEGHDETGLYAVNIIGVATDELMDVSRRLDFQHLKCCHNILFTSWSLPIVPDALVERLHAIDEVWVPNDFLAAAFARIFNGPILVMPPAMAEIKDHYPARKYYKMEESRFYFMCSFDYCSSPFQKNPFGVIEAFQKAFPAGEEG